MKYKPRGEVEAFPVLGADVDLVVTDMGSLTLDGLGQVVKVELNSGTVAMPGDWVVRGSGGRYWAVRGEVFEQLFEVSRGVKDA